MAAEKSKIINAVIFDIGQVLIRLDFTELMKMRGTTVSQDMKSWFAEMDKWDFYDQFERGFVTREKFYEEIKKTYGLNFSEQEFLTQWNTVLRETISPMDETLEKLKKRVKIYGLTNANAYHVDHMYAAYPITRHFDKIFSSHDLGCRKPEREIYEKVTNAIGIAPENILFVDDREENAIAARSFGWHAEHTPDNPKDVLAVLKKYGF